MRALYEVHAGIFNGNIQKMKNDIFSLHILIQ